MPERFDLRYELTREDWLAVNDAFVREGQAWKDARAHQRRAIRRQALWVAPLLVIGASLFIGRGQSTSGMYVEGAILGACFAVFLYFALPRITAGLSAKKSEAASLERADYSAHCGAMTVAADALGVHIRSPLRELKLSWQFAVPETLGAYIMLHFGGQDGTIIPVRAFASEAEAAGFVDWARAWWRDAQRPHAERLREYLADRDCACPRCKYNLRGLQAEVCPECGAAVQIAELSGL